MKNSLTVVLQDLDQLGLHLLVVQRSFLRHGGVHPRNFIEPNLDDPDPQSQATVVRLTTVIVVLHELLHGFRRPVPGPQPGLDTPEVTETQTNTIKQ